MSNCMLTTTDNPYSPFTQFDLWYEFDIAKGYNSCSYLARIARLSSELPDEDYKRIKEDAIDEIVRFNFSGKHKKVYENEEE